MFRHCAGVKGWVALRGFEHSGKSGRPAQSAWCPWGPNGNEAVEWSANMATDLARRTGDERAVFSPPVALFGDEKNASEARAASAANVVAGPVIAVELDSRPAESLATLEGVLGPATIIVASGGVWTAPDGSKQEKRHVYWRLAQPATDRETLLALTRARRIACDLVGADATGVSVAHPMRWPGSWHTKGEPRLCRIVGGDAERDVDLDEALAALEEAAKAAGVSVDQRGAALRDERHGFKTQQPLSAKTLSDAARLIPNGPYRDEADAWAKWIRVGMGFYDGSWASVDGLEAFHAWSAKHEFYDAEKTDQKWHRLTCSPPTDTSAGTLLKLMRDVDPEYVQDREIVETWFEEPGRTGLESGEGRPESPALQSVAANEAANGNQQADDASAPVFIRELNKRHAFVMDKGNAFVVNLEDGSEITFSRKAHFLDRYANRTVMNGKKESTQGEIWWAHDKRWQFLKGVDFDPNGVRPGIFNMWRGFPVLGTRREWPKPEDGCALILRHIREVVCAGDDKVAAYLLGWLAHMVQRPGEKPGVAVILKGRKGVGKDTLGDYVARFLGPYYVKVSHPSQLMGRFNAHLGGKLLIHAEELVWKNKSEEQSTLQSLITASEIAIEPKGVNIMMMKSQLRLIATSNAEHVVPASDDERRYLVLDVTDDKRGDRSWFGALRAEMEGDGPACLKRYLEGYPLEGFEVRDVPDTEALWRQKVASASPLDRWIQDELLGSDGTIWEEPDQPLVVSVEFLHSRYEKDTGRRNHAHVDKTVLAKHLQKIFRLGPSTQPRSENRVRVRTFPPREEARKLFEEHLGVRLDWP
ncbi:DUF5906 domain-containing protein [Aureimonas psammosilenae]|uniref:DUF5906 domain-containing protein n=1 Tax=Aureimonas psammosilenae TaxID=2495496 RepID=UPI001869B8AB|nr:DUF5906 domain-containing protein [Aureimonas psammosilenae]